MVSKIEFTYHSGHVDGTTTASMNVSNLLISNTFFVKNTLAYNSQDDCTTFIGETYVILWCY